MSKYLQRKKTSYSYSIISVSLVLFLIGFFGVILLYAHQNVEKSQSKIPVIIELKEAADSAALAALPKWLVQKPYIQAGTLRFVKKEEKLKEFIAEYGNDEALDITLIPFPDTYEFRIAPEWLLNNKTTNMKAEIKENAAVQTVVSDIDMAQEAANNAQRLAFFAFGIALLFVLIAVTLIHNTIRLALYADRFLIKNMELVGATWDFIARPYLLRGIKNGLWSALWAIFGVCILFWGLQTYLLEINDLLFSPIFIIFLFLLTFLGVSISWLSTYFVVNKYLKMKLDDLY